MSVTAERRAAIARFAVSRAGTEPPRWFVPGVLAVPYLVVIAATRGLKANLHTFHWWDEFAFHYPTILRFGAQWPSIDFVHYPAAQTPLYHTLMATVGQVIGLELWRLRLVEALLSYLLALALYALLRRGRGLERPAALALAGLLALSPYVFGSSFILNTDNLALGFTVATMYELERFRRRPGLGSFVLASLAICAAVLTRQSCVFLFPIAFGYLVLAGRPLARRARIAALGVLGLAAVPLGALVLAWGGLVPIGSDPSSCGLCPPQAGYGNGSGAGVFLRSVSFTFAVTAAYVLVLFAPRVLRGARDAWRSLRDGSARFGGTGALVARTLTRERLRPAVLPGAAALVALVMLAISPLHSKLGDAGWLWRLAGYTPTVLGSSALFWIIVPAGAAGIVLRWRANPGDWVGPLFFGSFLLVAVTTRLGYQKYYDPYALLAVLLTVRHGELRRGNYLGVATLLLGSMIYVAGFALGYVI
jgi:4-amino-4-deoxy-L-arabinose transferase-like glycosyltransferase